MLPADGGGSERFFILEMWNSARVRVTILDQGCFGESKVDCGAERKPDQLPMSGSPMDSNPSCSSVSLRSIYQQREPDSLAFSKLEH